MPFGPDRKRPRVALWRDKSNRLTAGEKERERVEEEKEREREREERERRERERENEGVNRED